MFGLIFLSGCVQNHGVFAGLDVHAAAAGFLSGGFEGVFSDGVFPGDEGDVSLFMRLFYRLLAVSVAVLVVTGLWVVRYANELRDVGDVLVEVPAGASPARVLSIVRERGLGPWKFGNEAVLRFFTGTKGFRAGVYRFSGRVSVLKVFDDFAHGRVDLVQVTFPEGVTAREMAVLLAKAGVTDEAGFKALAYDVRSPMRFGVPGPTLEGFLFPDTYRFARRLPPEAVAEAMTARFKKVAGEVSPSLTARGLDLGRWVTLASIVEKETGRAFERPLIASVFINRLREGMKLQTDPTVIYGIPDFDGNLRKADLLRDTPYNTYTRKGLPPGPIANPGRESLKAVAVSERSDYFYFVSRNDGTHVFSRTLGEHEAAVRRFQRGGR